MAVGLPYGKGTSTYAISLHDRKVADERQISFDQFDHKLADFHRTLGHKTKLENSRRYRSLLAIDEFAIVTIECEENSICAGGLSQYVFVHGPGLCIQNSLHIMSRIAQPPDAGHRYVLVGEKPHYAVLRCAA
jgi:hypothetical protein